MKAAPPDPLTNHELDLYLSRLPHYRAIYSHDTLPPKMNPDELTVVNLDSQAGPGTHWVGLANRKTLPFVLYYDSFGVPPSQPIARYLATSGKPIMYSSGNSQQIESVLCGAYVAKVLRLLSGKSHPIDAVHVFGTMPSAENERQALSEYKRIKAAATQ